MFSSQTPSQPAREHYKMRPAEPQFSWNPIYILHSVSRIVYTEGRSLSVVQSDSAHQNPTDALSL